MTDVDLDQPATKRDLLALRGDVKANERGLLELRNALETTESTLRGEIKASQRELSLQIAQAANSIMEVMTDRMRGVDDQYRDLPGRVTRLEDRVDRLERDDD